LHRRAIGYSCLAGFIACIFLANYSIQNWGTVPFPGGPHTVTIFGLTAPSGVLFVGLSFSLRDGAQMALGKWHILVAILLGAGLSYLVAPSLAWASGVAFLLGEGFDWAVYTPLVERGKTTAAIVASNTVGSAVDTAVFLWLAFSSLDFFWGQFWLKTLMIVPALLIVVPFRMRHRAVSRHVA
jgi:queuosine precursor transporter